MQGGKEDNKMMAPMFPRLHVNDADRGGPRAPPRNKMALYEQLSIPSQRFDSEAAAASLPSTQWSWHERNVVFSPTCVAPYTHTHLADRVHQSSDRISLHTTRKEFERRPTKQMDSRSLKTIESVGKCSVLRPHDSRTNNSCDKIFHNEDDYGISANAACSSKDTITNPARLSAFYAIDPHKSSVSTLNSSILCTKSNGKTLQKSTNSDMKLEEYEQYLGKEKTQETSVIKVPKEKSVPHVEYGETLKEASNFAKTSSEYHISTVNAFKSKCYGNAKLGQESTNALGGIRYLNDTDVVKNGDVVRVRNKSCPKTSLRINCKSPDMDGMEIQQTNDRTNLSFKFSYVDGTDKAYEASMGDTIQHMDISPDDVVGVIGPKQFWKARRAIVNQQRVFAIQVFELHRLIKVQKLIAASPHLLLEDNPYLSTPSPKVRNMIPSPEHIIKSHQHSNKSKDDPHKLKQSTMCPRECTSASTPLPSRDVGLGQGLPDKIPRNMPNYGNPHASVTPDERASAWCFQPPPNQWLVPIMSHSEGLVYKPYTGPCPPNAGLLAPIYGSCAPSDLLLMTGDFITASHQQHNMGALCGCSAIAPHYFPAPHSFPVFNPMTSASAVEQVRPLPRLRPYGHTEQNSRSSCNMPNLMSEAISGCPFKLQASKDSVLHGSTASSHCEKARRRDTLPLFPMTAVLEDSTRPSLSGDKDNKNRVIKVVPHNARSATASAARIFLSIQEERQRHDA